MWTPNTNLAMWLLQWSIPLYCAVTSVLWWVDQENNGDHRREDNINMTSRSDGLIWAPEMCNVFYEFLDTGISLDRIKNA